MTDRDIQFLLVYDHSLGKLLDIRTFEDPDEAVEEYSSVEQRFIRHGAVEVVLIGADSLDTVRVTHANYFEGSVTSPYLIGL